MQTMRKPFFMLLFLPEHVYGDDYGNIEIEHDASPLFCTFVCLEKNYLVLFKYFGMHWHQIQLAYTCMSLVARMWSISARGWLPFAIDSLSSEIPSISTPILLFEFEFFSNNLSDYIVGRMSKKKPDR